MCGDGFPEAARLPLNMKTIRRTCEEGFTQDTGLFQSDSAIESTLTFKVTLGLAPRRNPPLQAPQGVRVSYLCSPNLHLLQ